MKRLGYSFGLVCLLIAVICIATVQAQINGIGPIGAVERPHTGFQFTEGPAVDLLGNIYFTDVQRNRIHKIDTAGQLTTFLENTQGMNGLMLDPRGRLIGCQSAARRIVAIDLTTKEITPIASQFESAPFTSPNDLVIDRAGNIYFSDRNGNGVFFIATDNSVKKIISNLTLPNGVLLSLDEKTLYVLHTAATMMAYPLTSAGTLGSPQTIALQGNGGGDGMTIDTQGNLYVTRPGINSIQVLTPAGQSLGVIAFTEAPANCVFGGADMKTLFVTARTSVYTAKMISVGHRFASPVASVSAASFGGSPLAAETITAMFGSNLSAATVVANQVPLPTTLSNTTLKITDSAGVERNAPLFFVAPTQINYLLPAGLAAGGATVTVTNAGVAVFTEGIRIASAAPGLFSANSSGQGVAAAVVLRIKSDNSQSYEPVSRFDSATGRFVSVPIDLGAATDQVFLLAYGTGIRGRSALSAVTVTIGGTAVPVDYAGQQGDFVGLDQLNIRLLPNLAGRGEVDLTLTMDSVVSNIVRINIK
ncbi:MAG: SMP-30/gluconolactonase/LRE family protein [Blastocatellia bacterium]